MGDNLEPRSYRITVTFNRLNVEGLSARLCLGWEEGGGRGRRIKLTQNLRKMSGENVNDVLNISNSKNKVMNHQWF